ncbi:hypothetical protein ACOMHN_027724 [Nucella lapillus]
MVLKQGTWYGSETGDTGYGCENDLEDQEDIYDTVYTEDEDKIYDDLCSVLHSVPQNLEPKTKRDHCVKELLDTEKNYVDVLEMLVTPLLAVHKDFNTELNSAVMTGTPKLSDVFLRYKKKLLLYGRFCSNLPSAQQHIDQLCHSDTLRLKIQELLKNTEREDEDRSSLELALEAMQDLSLYVNEVKRDHEALQFIQEIQDSINDLRMPANTSLKDYGRFQKDGELKVLSHMDSRVRNRHIFLFDKVMLMCKARGETYSFKDAIVLGEYKTDDTALPNDKKGEKWNYPFIMVRMDKRMAFTFFAKTEDQRQKWVEAITLALGIFFQGYKCQEPRPPRPVPDHAYQGESCRRSSCDSCRSSCAAGIVSDPCRSSCDYCRSSCDPCRSSCDYCRSSCDSCRSSCATDIDSCRSSCE